jgi:hypothetical protein
MVTICNTEPPEKQQKPRSMKGKRGATYAPTGTNAFEKKKYKDRLILY